jgi:hypothetical protein
MHTLFYFLEAVMALSYAGMENQQGIFCITAIKAHISRQLSSFTTETINEKDLL